MVGKFYVGDVVYVGVKIKKINPSPVGTGEVGARAPPLLLGEGIDC